MIPGRGEGIRAETQVKKGPSSSHPAKCKTNHGGSCLRQWGSSFLSHSAPQSRKAGPSKASFLGKVRVELPGSMPVACGGRLLPLNEVQQEDLQGWEQMG